MTHVVVNADDLGIAQGVNTAIGRAFNAGVLTSASLMANMPAFDDAVERIIAPNARLGVGVHLVLTSGAPAADAGQLPLLVDSRGFFHHGFLGIRQLVQSARASAALEQIERELRAQCEKVLTRAVRVDHLDGHRHIHMIPEIWRIVVRLAVDYGFPYVRLADERWSVVSPRRVGVFARNLPKKILLSRYARRNRAHLSQIIVSKPVRTADRTVGILDSGAITSRNLGALLTRASSGVTEIIVHPGLMVSNESPVPCAAMDFRFIASLDRRLELEALTNPSVASAAARHGIHFTSFGELATATPRAA